MAKTVRTSDHFKVSPSILAPLGAEQLSDRALAVLELVKNSWDADAQLVKLTISSDKIKVADNGHGMDTEAFSRRWLTIGASDKRAHKVSPKGRVLIGEKGLGRLATFALGDVVEIKSCSDLLGFKTRINWKELFEKNSLEEYRVNIEPDNIKRGTEIVVTRVHQPWTKAQSKLLADHIRFLISVPDETFEITFKDPWETHHFKNHDSVIDLVSEASIRVIVDSDGEPKVEHCEIGGDDKSNLSFRKLPASEIDLNLSGAEIKLRFFRRNANAQLKKVLNSNKAAAVLKEFAGVRIYQDGINVPPYGLHGNDWAALEMQRTSTGGPTMTPGNSQLFGAANLEKSKHPQFVVTAGRTGFSDQQVVSALADYVRWTVRALATGRRAADHGIARGTVPVRSKKNAVQTKPKPPSPQQLKNAVASSEAKEPNSQTVDNLLEEYQSLWDSFSEQDEWLRLYAQLASSGIASTSFAHELRTDFDVMSSTVRQIQKSQEVTAELEESLVKSWTSIRAFASLFQLLPVRVRRKKQSINSAEIAKNARKILRIAEHQGVKCSFKSDKFIAQLVPAELDSILLNLISNSLKAIRESKNRKNGRITLEFQVKSSALQIVLKDNGCGVSSSVKGVMFRPLEGAFREGTGMGLPIVQYLASQYDGSVGFVPSDNNETTFMVVLKRVLKG